jgi:acyl-CoA reductase-like NAD-dependent aldehyde dehydrogenase
MTQSKISDIINKQQIFFNSGITKDIPFRIQQLKVLKEAITKNEDEILKAVNSEMKKPLVEAYVSEVGLLLNEIDYAIRNLKAWVKPKKVRTPIVHFLASSYIYSEPFGVVLIIGPWNYPFQLIISPLIGAIAAGNCSIMKPSETTSSSSKEISNIIKENFEGDYISVIEGGVETSKILLSMKFDYIFFTGNSRVGKIVMEAASKNLTPVTLELGGKCPCIVDRDVNIEYTAKRIVWGKFFNAGQTCVAPDYLLVDKIIEKELLDGIKKYVLEFYGDEPSRSPDYARIINKKQFNRLSGLLKEGEIIVGGNVNANDLYIAPTVIDNISLNDKIMEDEILGPILPVIECEDLTDAISIVNERPKPLALYFFSKDKRKQEIVLRETSSGGVCINDTIVHLSTISLPFGGVGNSGMGNYHGKASFDTFSHKKSILRKSFLFDINVRYPPYEGKLKLLKRFF